MKAWIVIPLSPAIVSGSLLIHSVILLISGAAYGSTSAITLLYGSLVTKQKVG